MFYAPPIFLNLKADGKRQRCGLTSQLNEDRRGLEMCCGEDRRHERKGVKQKMRTIWPFISSGFRVGCEYLHFTGQMKRKARGRYCGTTWVVRYIEFASFNKSLFKALAGPLSLLVMQRGTL